MFYICEISQVVQVTIIFI